MGVWHYALLKQQPENSIKFNPPKNVEYTLYQIHLWERETCHTSLTMLANAT